jgi:outer membrane lipase/esterase
VKLSRIIAAGVMTLCLPALAEAQNYNQLVAFGGSTTDTGWYANAKLSPVPNVFDVGIASAIAAGGNAHFTGPGVGNAQILGAFFGVPANSANTPGGTNYAIGGSFINSAPAPDAAFTNFLLVDFGLPPNPALPAMAGQISNYLAAVNGRANPNALYLIGGSGNDLLIANALGLSLADASAYFASEAQALAHGVAQLQAAGARYIIVDDTGSGITSTTAAYGPILSQAVWNALVSAGVKFIPADSISVIAAVQRNPAAFGITHDPTATGPSAYACLPPLGSGITSGYGATCAPTTTPSSTHGYLQSADATQTYLFMDGIHLTQAGETIVADYYYSLLAAPSEISFLAETTVQTTYQTILGIQQEIDLSQRQRPAGWSIWMNGNVSSLQIRNSSPGLPNDPGVPVSGTVGFDYHWLSGWLAGVALTVGNVNPTFSLGGDFRQNEGAFSAYVAYARNNWWGNLIGGIGISHFDTSRDVPIGITVQPNNGSTNGTDLYLAGEVGYDFHTGFLTHGPVAGFILQRADVHGFTESGSFTSLSFDTQIRNSEVSLIGYRIGFDWGIWHPYVQLLWDHEFDPLDRVVTASLTTTTAPSFSLPAVVVGRDWANATVGTQFKIDRSWSGLASFTAQLGQQNVTNYGGLVSLHYAFGQDDVPPPLVYKH